MRGKRSPYWLYSDEEINATHRAIHFYDPHIKQDFNLGMLLTNNYICHFMRCGDSLDSEAADS